jgi:hypothetical protein
MPSAAEFRHCWHFAVNPGQVRRACDHDLRLPGRDGVRPAPHAEVFAVRSRRVLRALVSGHFRGVGTVRRNPLVVAGRWCSSVLRGIRADSGPQKDRRRHENRIGKPT